MVLLFDKEADYFTVKNEKPLSLSAKNVKINYIHAYNIKMIYIIDSYINGMDNIERSDP